MQQTTPQEPHTAETQGEENKPTISPDLQHIRDKAPLTQTTAAPPQINKRIAEDYAEEEVGTTIQQLKNIKSDGQDGIPGETHIALNPWVVKPLTSILGKIKNRDKLPPEWTQGAMVHIYKKKGDARECKKLQTHMLDANHIQNTAPAHHQKLIQILHLMTGQTQYGCKQGLSALDSILKIEQYIQEGAKGAQILLMIYPRPATPSVERNCGQLNTRKGYP